MCLIHGVLSYWSEAQVDFLYMVVGLQQHGFVAEDELMSIKTCPAIAIIPVQRFQPYPKFELDAFFFCKCCRTADFLYTHTPSLYTSHLQRKI
jgi:hypothetical protein